MTSHSPAENEKVVREALAWNGVGSTPALAALAALCAQAEAGEQAREKLRGIADAGCENVTDDMRECMETKRDRANWCWPCIARAAFLTDEELADVRADARAALSGEPS